MFVLALSRAAAAEPLRWEDPVAVTEHICHSFGYAARLATSDGEIVDALPTIRSLGGNTSWGSAIRNRNVLFLARP